MRRKKPQKKGRKITRTPKKPKAPRYKPLTTSTPRGRNRIIIEFPEGRKTVDDVIVQLLAFNWNKLNYLYRKNKVFHPLYKKYLFKPPQGITVIIEIKKGKNTYHFTRVSPLTMIVNIPNIQDFVMSVLEELESSWTAAKEAMRDGDVEDDPDGPPMEYVEKLDPKYIKSITIHFLY